MGRVYLGKSPEGMLVAVKVVRAQLAGNGDFRRRFRREIDAMARVGGGFVAELVDAEPGGDQPWFATRFIPGSTLSSLVWPAAPNGTPLPPRPLPTGTVWRLAWGLVKALQAVHVCQVVHRDLKPGNVMLSPFGPRVIDFGIAKGLAGSSLADSPITLAGNVIGTPGYMSPEQGAGLVVGQESDVYSLGAVLAAVSTGVVPERDSQFRLLWRQPGLSRLPAELHMLVGSCLEPRSADRPTLNQLMSEVLHGQKPYPPARPSYWPEPTATLVGEAADYTFGSFPSGAGRLSMTDNNGRETWYLRDTEAPHRRSPGIPPGGTKVLSPELRPGLDGMFYPAYRSVLAGGSVLDRRPGQERDANEWAAEGDRHLKARRYGDAERAYRESLRLDSKNPVVWTDLGRTLCPPGRMREAESAFAQALDLSPRLIAARRNLYLAVYLMGGSVPAANVLEEELLEACLAVLEIEPTGPEEYANLGDAYCTLGQCTQGAAAYQSALRGDPDNPRLEDKNRYATRDCR